MRRTFILRYSMMFFIISSILACQEQPNFKGDNFLSEKIQELIGGKPDLRHSAVGAFTISKVPFCTATLIRPDVVLTAAHCIDAAKRNQGNSKAQFRVDFPQGKGFKSEFYEIISMVNHPNYQKTAFSEILADIGLVFLKKPVSNVAPIPFNEIPLGQSWVKKKLLFLGYGLVRTVPGAVQPTQKHGLDLEIKRLYGDRIELYEHGKSLCNGDSGGPSLALIGRKLFVLSVNSYGRSTRSSWGGQILCNGESVVFRTDTFTGWLNDMLAKHTAKCSKAGAEGCGSCYSCSAAKRCIYKSSAPNHPMYCRSCRKDGDCKGKGFRCISLKGRHRCMPSCSGSCCPKGTHCRTFSMLHEKVTKSCVPNLLKCPIIRCSKWSDCGSEEICLQGVCSLKVKLKRQKISCERCEKDSDCTMHSVCASTADGRFCLEECIGQKFCLKKGWKCKATLKGRDVCYHPSKTCACSDDKRCSGGRVCRAGKCQKQGWKKEGATCSHSDDCLAPFVCLTGANGNKTCLKQCFGYRATYPEGVAGSHCSSFSICNEGLLCITIAKRKVVCSQLCYGSGLCPNGGICEAIGRGSVGQCLCRKATDCNIGYGCNRSVYKSMGVCAKKTISHLCKKNQVCSRHPNSKYYCLLNRKCKTQSDCPLNMLCDSGSCTFDRTRCSDDESCARGLVCRKDTHRCSKPKWICKRDSDCKSSHVCDLIRGCVPRMCRKDEDCPKGKICKRTQCIESGVIRCTKDVQCPRTQWCLGGICKEQKAYACRSNLDCAKSEVCAFGSCIHLSEFVESSNEPLTNVEPFERLKFDASVVKESKVKIDKKRWLVPNAFRKNLPRLAISRGCACAQSSDSLPFENLLGWGGFLLLAILRRSWKSRKDCL